MQRVFRREGDESTAEPTCLCFSETGKSLAVGFDDGRLSVLKTDTANELTHFEQAQEGLSDQEIGYTSVIWKQANFKRKSSKEGPADLHRDLISKHLTEKLFVENNLSFIFAGDAKGDVQAILDGIF